MKWYSVKKYKPPLDMPLFVFVLDGNLWTCKYTLEHENDDDIPLFVSDTDGMSIFGVTHFCIPDPVEIEFL